MLSIQLFQLYKKDVLRPIVSEYSVNKGFPVEWLESTSTIMDELECIIMYDV